MNAATEILCRFDPASQTPVVFVADTMENDQIQAWKGTGPIEYVPLAYYHITRALSAEDERVLTERFKSSTGKQNQIVKVRHRLPRTSRPIPNLLANSGSAFNANQPRANNEKVERRNPHAKSIDAMPVPPAPVVVSEREVVSAGQGVATVAQAEPVAQAQVSIAQASPADVLNGIATLSQEFNQQMMAMNTQFNAKIAQLANMLAPKQQ